MEQRGCERSKLPSSVSLEELWIVLHFWVKLRTFFQCWSRWKGKTTKIRAKRVSYFCFFRRIMNSFTFFSESICRLFSKLIQMKSKARGCKRSKSSVFPSIINSCTFFSQVNLTTFFQSRSRWKANNEDASFQVPFIWKNYE